MNKKIIAILAAVGLFSTGVYAGGNFQDISVSFDAVKKLVIYGQDKTPTDVKPFIYNNVTYVPLRYVSEQLSIPVAWDADTGTVYVGENPVRANTDAVPLATMKMSSTYHTYLYRINNSTEDAYNVDTDGANSFLPGFKMRFNTQQYGNFTTTAYEDGVAFKVYAGGTRFYYDVLGKYKTLTGIIGFDSDINSGDYRDMAIQIVGDGKVLQTLNINASKQSENVSVSLEGVQNLSIQCVNPENSAYEPFLNMVSMELK